jgi:hypothetical protein
MLLEVSLTRDSDSVSPIGNEAIGKKDGTDAFYLLAFSALPCLAGTASYLVWLTELGLYVLCCARGIASDR